jgi:peroxiredoxin
MVTSICLLACSLTIGQVVERGDWQLSPQLLRGQELVYSGTYVDESIGPNVRHQKIYRLDTTLFVLDTLKQYCSVAVMTALTEQDMRPAPVTAVARPVSVRLALAKIDAQGRIRSADDKALSLAINGPSTLEFGFLVEVPLTRVGKNAFWEVNEESRPVRSWQVIGTEACAGVTCIKLVAAQQSLDWDHPRADQTAWRRKDVVWLTPQFNVALKVERTVERRDPAHQNPTHKATVRYELESKLRYPGKMFDDRQREILAHKKFQDEAAPFLREPALYRSQLDSVIRKVSFHIDNQPDTPYRKALLNLKQGLESARRGEAPVPNVSEDPVPIVRRLTVGERIPDFVVTSLTDKQPLHMQKLLGQPTLVFFYNPATGVGRDVVLYAKQLCEKQAGKLHFMAMAVTPEPETARKQHADLRLPFPVLDGHAMRMTLGVENTPRFVLVDAEGIMRWESTGWGVHVPGEIAAELVNCQKR